MTKTIALVVPALENTGGVTSVARFVMRTILDRTDYRLKLVSLATAMRDPDSLLITDPRSWFRGVRTSKGVFHGQPFTHVGARFAEIETQRLRPRAELMAELSDVDLVQLVCGSPSWGAALIGCKVPVCIQAATLIAVERKKRDAELVGRSAPWKRLMTRAVTRLETPAMRHAACVQVENGWMFDHASKVTEVAGTHVTYGYPGVDVEVFHPAPERPQGPGYILAVGRMADPRKNVMLLLDAYTKVHSEMANPPRLVIAGASGPGDEFMEAVRARGLADRVEVHLKLDQPELAALFRGARAFALTSTEEGFGVTLIEAMASGTPPVSTRSGGPDEIIADGEDGFLAGLDDAETIAARLRTLVDDDALNARMSRAARAKVEARYSTDVAGQAFLDSYARILE